MHDVIAEMNLFYREVASKSKGGGWRAVGMKIGKSGTYARQVALGSRPLTSEIAIAWMISNGQPPDLIPTHPCPSCAARGIIYSHGDKLDCHDKPVVAVALLAPGEVVLPAPMPKRKRRRKAYWRPCFPLMSDQAKRKVWAYAHDLAALEKEHSNDNLLRA